MKSAEDWCDDMFGSGNWLLSDTAAIGAIQADARRAALQEAADIAEMFCYGKETAYEYATNVGAKVSNAILSLAEKKEGE